MAKKYWTKKRKKKLAKWLRIIGWVLIIGSFIGVALVGLGVI